MNNDDRHKFHRYNSGPPQFREGDCLRRQASNAAEFMGKETRKTNDDRLKLAGNLMIMSAKGTKKIRLSDLETPTLPADFKGHYVTTGRGTGRVRL